MSDLKTSEQLAQRALDVNIVDLEIAHSAEGQAGVLILLARRGFRRDLLTRPPAQPFGYGGGRQAPRFTTPPRMERA